MPSIAKGMFVQKLNGRQNCIQYFSLCAVESLGTSSEEMGVLAINSLVHISMART